MTGHGTTGSGQAVLERIVLPVTKPVPMTNATPSVVVEEDASYTKKPEKLEKHERRKGNENISNTQRLWTSLVSGATAGAVAKTTIAPLDRTKINFQISKQRYSARAAIKFLWDSYRSEGLLSLWRGNSATMVRIVPYSAIQFAAHEQWKRILKVNGSERTKPGLSFLAGSLAGVTSQSLTYPLDLMRARMAVTLKTEYKGLWEVCVRIYREEGALAYYRGFTPTIIGVIPYAGVSFFTHDLLKSLLAVYTANRPELSAISSLVCGALAGVVSQTASYPLDIVRRRMQTSAVKGQHYHTMWSTIIKIYREERAMAFFKGLSMNWVKGPLAVGISFATYDVIRNALRKIIS